MSTRGRGAAAAVVAGVVACAAGVALWHADATATPSARERNTSSTDGTRAPTPSPVAAPAPVLDHRVPAGSPRRVVIPALDVNAPVLAIKAPAGTLVPPSDPMTLGWWSQGAMPGARHGSALITGHTMHAGEGALNDLERLHRGDRVRVRTPKGTLRYRVTSTRILGKGELAHRAERLFEQGGPARLVLVTCEDWNGHEYLSNVVVTATPAPR